MGGVRFSRGNYIFPTPVGVFLYDAQVPDYEICLPHARGGVSDY